MINFLKRTYLLVRGGVPMCYLSKSIELFFVGKLRLAVLFVWVLLSSALLHAQVNKPADVRVLIDISGSMKKNDPNNLRAPALDLLVQLLPAKSKAGVWTFGNFVNMLVPHGEVTADWRLKASEQAKSINSVALRTNMGLVLEKANYDRDPQGFPASNDFQKSVILLTDGMVDISRDAETNQRERERLLNEILPEYQSAGVAIHTIALSRNADIDLLQSLSRATNGIFALAESAADLNKVFLRAIDQAAAGDRVPLEDNRFLIDTSVEEFTALVFKRAEASATQLTSPTGEVFNASTASSGMKWLSHGSYDLVTIKEPIAGEWFINAEFDPENRVTIVSDLQLSTGALPTNIYIGQPQQLTVQLNDGGRAITDKNFLDLLTVTAAVARVGADSNFQVWQKVLEPSAAQSGVYRRSLDMLSDEGPFAVSVLVDGKTFKRQHQMNVMVRHPFRTELAVNQEKSQFKLTVIAEAARFINSTQSVYANIVDPQDELQIVEFSEQAVGVWSYTAADLARGTHVINLFVRPKPDDRSGGDSANTSDKVKVAAGESALDIGIREVVVTGPELVANEPAPAIGLAEVEAPVAELVVDALIATEPVADEPVVAEAEVEEVVLALDLPADTVPEQAAKEAPEVVAEPAPEDMPEVELDSTQEDEVVSDEPPMTDIEPAEAEPKSKDWMIYTALGVGNLLMVAILVLVYKKLTATAVVDEDADDEGRDQERRARDAERDAAKASDEAAAKKKAAEEAESARLEAEAEADAETGTEALEASELEKNESTQAEPQSQEPKQEDAPDSNDLDAALDQALDQAASQMPESAEVPVEVPVEPPADPVAESLAQGSDAVLDDAVQSADDSVSLDLDDDLDLDSDMSENLAKRPDKD